MSNSVSVVAVGDGGRRVGEVRERARFAVGLEPDDQRAQRVGDQPARLLLAAALLERVEQQRLARPLAGPGAAVVDGADSGEQQ